MGWLDFLNYQGTKVVQQNATSMSIIYHNIVTINQQENEILPIHDIPPWNESLFLKYPVKCNARTNCQTGNGIKTWNHNRHTLLKKLKQGSKINTLAKLILSVCCLADSYCLTQNWMNGKLREEIKVCKLQYYIIIMGWIKDPRVV